MTGFSHKSVLFDECMTALNIRDDKNYIDGTAGGGGHSQGIADRLKTGKLLLIDKDPNALATVTKRFENSPNVIIARGDFSEISDIAAQNGFDEVAGVLLDIGVSSHQLDTAERGFSFHSDAPLDMRMSMSGLSAYDVVNGYEEENLSKIFFEYGEERFARQIARKIVKYRESSPIKTTLELAEVIKSSLPPAARRAQGHPAQRSFQAIRIEVNSELDALRDGIDNAFNILEPGGRLAIISFHSLEDRIVKQRFAGFTKGCECPPDFPVCVCGKKPRGELVFKKPVTAAEEELLSNPRSRSAKLRCVEKL